MFGWEYPPHVYGGLATANYGITEGLHAQGDMDITLCLPKPFGDEDRTAANLLAMNCVPIAWRGTACRWHGATWITIMCREEWGISCRPNSIIGCVTTSMATSITCM